MTTLLLVRHGQSEANKERVFAGHYDADISELGLKQAQCTAQYVCKNYKIDKVYASDLKRAYKTGKCVADILGIDIIADKNLREISAGKWEAVEFDVLCNLYSDDYNLWLTDIGNSCCTEGESVSQLADRVMSAFKKIALENGGKTILIATHATPIRVVQSIVETGSLDEMKNIPWVSNASVSVLNYDNENWNFEEVSHDSHLEDLKTSLPANV